MGCGWLGAPLAEKLLAEGWEVYGSSRSLANLEGLQALGLKPFRMELPETLPAADDPIWQLPYYMVNMPPTPFMELGPLAYAQSMALLAERMPAGATLFFVSSTGVYGPQKELFWRRMIASQLMLVLRLFWPQKRPWPLIAPSSI